MQPGPAAAAEWVIAEFPLTHEPIGLEPLIVHIGEKKSWFGSEEEAQERAESWKGRLATRLTKNLDDARRRGWPARYDFNSSDSGLIQGSSFVEGSESPELKQDKAARIHMDNYLQLAQAMTGRQFEAVCRGILDLMGCEKPVLTPRGNDQGIDFHGRLEMTGRLNRKYAQGSIDRAMGSWIVGQAKQVGNPVGTSEIRDLTGSLELARYKVSADGGKALAKLDIKPYESVFPLFVTTGVFTRDAWRLIDGTGLVGMDGPMVGAFLADHCIADVGGICDADAFRVWVEAQLADDGD